MLGNFACFLSSVDVFFKLTFFQKHLSGIQSECQTVWIQIRSDVLSGLIWIQTVCKDVSRRQKPPVAEKELRAMNTLKKYKRTLHYETSLFKYIDIFTTKKGNFSDKKKWDILHISAQNTDCWYSLEPPRRGGSYAYPQSMFLSRNMKNNI